MRKLPRLMTAHKWFLITLFLAVFLVYLRFNQGVVQQDNYVGYAKMFPGSVGNISFFESRLFPGLPLLIYLLTFITNNYFISGYLITLLSFVGCYVVLHKITKSKLSFLPLIFPPIMLNLASLIDTEFPFIFLIILGYYLLKKEKLLLAFLIIGISIWFRLAGTAGLAGIFIYFLIMKRSKDFFLNLPYFIFPVVLLLVYNAHYFGSENLFYQLFTYQALHPGRISVGVVQLGMDLIRAVRWHWYRIFISGLFYIIFFLVLWVKSIKLKSLEFWIITGIYIFTLSINLVPFLENFGRYLAPAIPFFWTLYYKRLESMKLLYLFVPLSLLVVLI